MEAAQTIHWTCQCGQKGSGFIPDECPVCEHYLDATLTKEGWQATIRAEQMLRSRAEHIADMLDYGSEKIEYSYSDREDGTFEVSWESANCRCGCSGYSTHTESIPTRYLWMSDEDIRAEQAAKKMADEAKIAAEKRKKELADAEAAFARAQARAATAATEAAQALVDAERNLANIRSTS